jgi:DNA-binding LacI/PurR family transcriptional regulator
MRGKAGQASEETCRRVLEAMQALNYVPVAPPSRQQVHTPTRIIGLVFDHIKQDDYWGSGTYRGLRDGALENDYDLLTILRAQPKWNLNQEELRFMDRRSDGFIFIVPRDRYGVLETLAAHRIPVVTCYNGDVPPGIPTVVLDNAGAMQQAVTYLKDKGHSKIAHLAWHTERADFRERLEGFQKAMHPQAQKNAPVIQIDLSDDWSADMEKALQNGVTAITCSNDLAAFEFRRLAHRRGWKIPRDVSLIGMDDMPESAQVGLSTFRFCCEEVGREAVASLLGVLRGEEVPLKKVVPVELVERTTVAPPRANVTI